MSYAEAKEIALLRLELRTCWEQPATTRAQELALAAAVAGRRATTTSWPPRCSAGRSSCRSPERPTLSAPAHGPVTLIVSL